MRKVRDTDLNIYVFVDGYFFYDEESVLKLVERHDKLVDKLKEREANG